jgi:hypothetical protein
MLRTKFIPLVAMAVGILALAQTGPDYQKDLDELKTTQQAILQRLEKLEKGQEALATMHKEILTRLDTIIKEESSVFPQLRKALQGRDSQEQDLSKIYDIPLGNSPVKGSDTATIIIAEFSDFQ